MLQVLPPNKESVRATAELALDYLSQGKYDYAKIVIENVINGLSDPDFGKPHRDYAENTISFNGISGMKEYEVSATPGDATPPKGYVEMIGGKLEFIEGTPNEDTWGKRA
jgi:hypothetical protein